MTKIKKVILSGIFMLLTLLLGLSLLSGKTARAETVQEDKSVYVNEEVAPNGMLTNLTLEINAGDGQVWATVKNKFTLFPATVTVRVELYNSNTYQESYTNMAFIISNYIYDLDIGKSITVSHPTEGYTSYWKARMYYNIDGKGWQERVTATVLVDGNGTILG